MMMMMRLRDVCGVVFPVDAFFSEIRHHLGRLDLDVSVVDHCNPVHGVF